MTVWRMVVMMMMVVEEDNEIVTVRGSVWIRSVFWRLCSTGMFILHTLKSSNTFDLF